MSITEGTQPAALQFSGAWTTAQTTASFTPESGALLVALLAADGDGVANTTATISDSLSGTWTQLALENTAATGLGGIAAVWCRDSPGTSMTVSVTGGVHTAAGGQLVVRTLIGALATASQNGATGIAGPAPGAIQVSVAAGTGNRVYGAAFNFDNSTAMTALGNTSVISQDSDTTNGDDWEAFKSSADTAGTATYGYSTSVHGMIAAAEIKAAPVSAVTFTPQRYGQAAPPSQAPWEQRPYRSLPGVLDTPASPLPSPLDTAWQAGGRYHHLYNDSHLRDRRAYFYQRPLVSDPTLLQPAGNLDPTTGGQDDLARRYRTPATHTARWWMPQQRPYVSDPLLLTTALLENELLGGADTARHNVTSLFIDRRLVPAQRPYPDRQPDAGADVGAGVTMQWTGPEDLTAYIAQRRLISDPSSYPPQNNLDPLLAGQDLLELHQHQAATHYDRREVPQQRPYISDPSTYPTTAPADPLTVAWGAGGNYWHLYNRAADITDRREVPQQRPYVSDPSLLLTAQLENELLGGAQAWAHTWWQRPGSWPQQRAYISDPSFYPTVAPADPLTIAWGAGGPYWHLYNRAADAADRRMVPQQRNYVSDPLLPTTALLENELLGGADDLARHRAWYADRREVPAQRIAITLPDIPADPLTLGDDRARHLLIAGYWPRGWSEFQRLYFPLPAPPPPFLVARSASAVTDPRDGTASVTAAATSTSTVS